jgi:LysM repeat protein
MSFMSIRARRIALRSIILLLILTAWIIPERLARGKMASDPMAIISLVNALRAAQGLPPYVVDQGLMAYALEHSRYQASIHNATHQHSDGTTVWEHGMDENIATGMLGFITPEFAVYTVWSDAIHMKTMIGYPSGSVGCGVADDGADEYYTLDVRPGGKALPTARPNDPNATPTKIIPIVPLLTVTPRMDRWIIHTVGYGQTLWAVAVAYGVKMDMIRAWNSMPADSTSIYAGQKLYIIAPGNIWPTLTASPEGMLPEGGGTVTPRKAITEEPLAATQKSVYQTAAAQTQGPGQAPVLSTAPPQATAAHISMANTDAPLAGPTAQATASPTSGGTASVTPAAAAGAGSLPLVAGILILLGGGLLVGIAFMMMRRK